MNKAKLKHIRKIVTFWLLVVVTFPVHMILNGCVLTISYLHDVADREFIDSFIK